MNISASISHKAGDERSSHDPNVHIKAANQRAANKREWLRRANAAAKSGDPALSANLRHQAEIC